MEIVLRDTPTIPKTYTGDPRQWPDGLYVAVGGPYHILKTAHTSLMFTADDDNHFTVCTAVCCKYTRIPGYTGGISSITPEREEAGR